MLKKIGKKLICIVIILCLMLGGIMAHATDAYANDEGADFGLLNIDVNVPVEE